MNMLIRRPSAPYVFLVTALALMTALVLLAPCAFAGEEDEGIFSGPVSIRVKGTGTTEAEFDDGGKVGSYSVRTSANWSLFDASYTYTGLSWSDTDNLRFAPGANSPIDGLHRIALGISYGDEFAENWSWFAGARGTSSFEKEMDGSFGGALRAGLGYEFAEDWEVTFGAIMFANNLRVEVLPLVELEYDGVDENGMGFFGTLGILELEAGYSFDKTLKLTAAFGQDSTTWRLANDSEIRRKGYLMMEDYMVGLTVDWEFAEGWRLAGGPEYRFNRKWTLYDSDGGHDKEYDLGNAWGGGLTVRYSF